MRFNPHFSPPPEPSRRSKAEIRFQVELAMRLIYEAQQHSDHPCRGPLDQAMAQLHEWLWP
jgi:hypothetical protein